jgi:predicted Zn-dependent protease with MMP-like domain
LRDLARSEVEATLEELPEALRRPARAIPVTYLARPDRALRRSGVADDTLGLFVGEAYPEESTTSAPLPAQILLFLGNLWEMAEGDAEVFCDEVRTTLLHELGHYLGLDEEDLDDRGLL